MKTGKTTWQITAVTPVHIGSGNELTSTDYFLDKSRLIIVDFDNLVEQARENENALMELAEGSLNFSSFKNKYNIPVKM